MSCASNAAVSWTTDAAWYASQLPHGCCPAAEIVFAKDKPHHRCCNSTRDSIRPLRPVGGCGWRDATAIGSLFLFGDSMMEQAFVALLCLAWSEADATLLSVTRWPAERLKAFWGDQMNVWPARGWTAKLQMPWMASPVIIESCFVDYLEKRVHRSSALNATDIGRRWRASALATRSHSHRWRLCVGPPVTQRPQRDARIA